MEINSIEDNPLYVVKLMCGHNLLLDPEFRSELPLKMPCSECGDEYVVGGYSERIYRFLEGVLKTDAFKPEKHEIRAKRVQKTNATDVPHYAWRIFLDSYKY